MNKFTNRRILLSNVILTVMLLLLFGCEVEVPVEAPMVAQKNQESQRSFKDPASPPDIKGVFETDFVTQEGVVDPWIRATDDMTMVYVPKGTFLMGSEWDDEWPVHEVSLDAFWIDRTEVTNDQFAQFVEETGYGTTAEKRGSGRVYTGKEWEWVDSADWQHPQGPYSNPEGREDHPVVQVSWDDAEAYCEWVEARLPTEAEWEYAARGPEEKEYPWGNSFDGEKANFCDINCTFDWADESVYDGYGFTSPVGSYPAGESWVGTLDMSGNVWEWTNDWYDENYYADSPGRNPQGPDSGEKKVLRGGSWNASEVTLRAAYRDYSSPDYRNDNLGFRCAVSPGE